MDATLLALVLLVVSTTTAAELRRGGALSRRAQVELDGVLAGLKK